LFAGEHCTYTYGMEPRAREPVSRRGQAIRPALSRAVIIEAALQIADSESLDAVTMRRVAATLDTSASALYVYIQGREDLLDAMFDYVMAAVAQAAIPADTWRERLSWLLIKSVQAASGHGGLAQVALAKVPSGPNAREITARVRELLAEGQIPETAIPAALDLLGLFVTAAALDRVPAASSTPRQHHDLLRWEIEVILNGLATTAPQIPHIR
jgi:AcrR family transcriptional regulator